MGEERGATPYRYAKKDTLAAARYPDVCAASASRL